MKESLIASLDFGQAASVPRWQLVSDITAIV